MKTQTSIYISEKDQRKIDELRKAYDLQSTSELVRILIDKEYKQLNEYKEILL